MTNNVTLNVGTGGATLATDDVTDSGGAHYQIIKLADGTENSTTVIAAGGGAEANALRVTIASDSTGVLSIDDNGASLTVDNANIDNLHSSDFDTGAGTDTTSSIGIAVPAAGGAAVITGDITNGLDVDVTRVSGTVTVDASGTPVPVTDNGGSLTVDNTALSQVGGGTEAAALRVTLASDSTGLVSVDDNGGSLTVDNAALSVTGGGTEAGALRVTMASDSTGVLSVDDNGGSLTVDVGTALPAGTNNIGDVDVASIAAGTNVIGDVGISGARTSGGSTPYRNIDVNATPASVKGSAGQIYWIHAMNQTASPLYFHIYNVASGSVTVGTTTPTLTYVLPTQATTDGAGFTLSIPNGIAFSTAITIACATTIGGGSGPATNGCVVNLGYA